MRQNQVIEFVTLREIRATFENKKEFTFRKDRPAQWLQKACFFILRKIGANSLGESVTIERTVIDGETFIQRLFKQQEGITRFFGFEPTKMLIGAEDYAEIMREAAMTNMFQFTAEYYHTRKICGLTVYVVPWMRGVLVLPNELKAV